MQAVDRGLSWLWRIIIMLGLVVGVLMPPLLLQLVNELTGKPALAGWLVTAVISYFAIFLGVSGVAAAVYRHYTGTQQLKWLQRKDLLIVVGGYLVIIGGEGILQLLNQLLYHQSETQNNELIIDLMSGSPVALVMMVTSAVFLTPIMEELVFRGVLMNLFFQSTSLKIALSAMVFASLHSSTTLPSFLIYLTMGIILASVYHYTGKLRAAMLLHFLINAGAMSFILLNWY